MSTPCEALPSLRRKALIRKRPSQRLPALSVALAGSRDEIRACQQLRCHVFAWETGVERDGGERETEHDEPGPLHKHLLVRDNRSGGIVATTRLLIDSNPDYCGRYEAESAFDMKNVLDLPGRLMEAGRTSIHPEHRNDGTIDMLWQGLARMMEIHDVDHLLCCVGITLDDGGANAAHVMEAVREHHFAAPHLRVYPKKRVPTASTTSLGHARIPSLLKTYLHLGAVVCGEPSWDAPYNAANVLLLLDRDQIGREDARPFAQG